MSLKQHFSCLPSWKGVALVGTMAFLLAACGDDDSDFVSRPDGDAVDSSSSVSSQSSSSSTKESSSSSVKSSTSSSSDGFDWSLPKETYLNPEIDYGTMMDERDGKKYKTVTIGDQTWMAENLNFDPGQGGAGDAKYEWSWCYDNEPENCDVVGRLYTWAAAIDSVKLAIDAENPQDCGYGKSCRMPAKVQGICPTGWHLPAYAEWEVLFTAVGGRTSRAGKDLKSQSGWYHNDIGTDAFGFSALPAGNRANIGYFDNVGNHANFWSATESDSFRVYYMHLFSTYDFIDVDVNSNKNIGYSVRCLKD